MRIDVIIEPQASPDMFGELGALAESYGIGAVWTANHDSARDPFICFSQLARQTSKIRLGPIAISPFEYHPLKMATRIADGVMMSDVTLPRMDESIGTLKDGLAEAGRSAENFHINNLYAWHVKKDKNQAIDEAKRKIWVRGLLQRWYLTPFLSEEDCDLIDSKQGTFARSYFANSPVVEGISDRIMDALVDNITLTGDFSEIDKQIDIMKQFEAAGFTEFGLRLYEDPAESIKLIGERVVPAFH